MKKIIFLFSLTLFNGGGIAHAQEIKGRSSNHSFYISKDPPKPPYLIIADNSLQFSDADGNDIIDANESTFIQFKLQNTGHGSGLNLKLHVKETNYISGLSFNKETALGTLKPDNYKIIKVPVSGTMYLKDGKANFKISISEANGFGTDPVYIEINTRSFVNPQVQIVDYTVTSEGSSTLVKKKPFEVQVLVQNIGQGNAKNVKVNLSIPQNMFCLSGNENENIGFLSPGATKLLNYDLIVNNLYSDSKIPLKYDVSERYGKYGEDKTITLTLNQTVSETKLKVEGRETSFSTKEIEIASLSADVDKNIPNNPAKYPNRYALIIGNEDYTKYQPALSSESNVEFARADARVFSKYAENVLGVPKDNITSLTDVISTSMEREITKICKISELSKGKAEIIFFYAGHGFPDETSKEAYIMPVNVTGNDVQNGIKLSALYKQFAGANAKRVTIFLDACFSGGGRDQGLIAARSVKIAPKKDYLSKGNIVIFSASSGSQKSLPYREKKHGMFTYFLLKKLQESKGNITYKKLSDYIIQQVQLQAVKNYSEQDPMVQTSNDVKDVWEEWKVR